MIALALLVAASAGSPVAESPTLIEYGEIPRGIAGEPEYVGAPRYGMFLFGEAGEARVWAVLDKSRAKSETYDVLHLDVNGNGTIGEEGECFHGETTGASSVFEIGDFVEPGTETEPGRAVVHRDFRITWTKASVRFKMMWRGELLNQGGFGPTRKTYASFGESPETATIYGLGYNRPLEFEHWMSDQLTAGESKDFKVFVGTRGSSRGAFSCGNDKFLPEGEYVLTTLIYTDHEGKEQRHRTRLEGRC